MCSPSTPFSIRPVFFGDGAVCARVWYPVRFTNCLHCPSYSVQRASRHICGVPISMARRVCIRTGIWVRIFAVLLFRGRHGVPYVPARIQVAHTVTSGSVCASQQACRTNTSTHQASFAASTAIFMACASLSTKTCWTAFPPRPVFSSTGSIALTTSAFLRLGAVSHETRSSKVNVKSCGCTRCAVHRSAHVTEQQLLQQLRCDPYLFRHETDFVLLAGNTTPSNCHNHLSVHRTYVLLFLRVPL
jgi:hypothetical protein